MATAKDQLFHLIEKLSETDAAKLVSDLRRNAPPERMLGERHNASTDDFETNGERDSAEMRIGASRLRWPALGPVAIGAAVLVGWTASFAGGPLAAIVGTSLGLFLGDWLDQRTGGTAEI